MLPPDDEDESACIICGYRQYGQPALEWRPRDESKVQPRASRYRRKGGKGSE